MLIDMTTAEMLTPSQTSDSTLPKHTWRWPPTNNVCTLQFVTTVEHLLDCAYAPTCLAQDFISPFNFLFLCLLSCCNEPQAHSGLPSPQAAPSV